MASMVSFRLVTAAVLAMVMAGPVAAQKMVGKGRKGPAPDPVVLDNTELFQEKFVSVGDDLFIGGQPTEKALRELKAKGVTTVVNLRMPQEMAQIGFDEAALLKELGITYVHIPMRGSAENPYGPAQLDTFARTLAGAQGKVLLHCTVAWRASHLWGAYLIRDRKMPIETVLAQTRKINLRDDAPFGTQQPIEGFLARPVPGLLPPKPRPQP